MKDHHKAVHHYEEELRLRKGNALEVTRPRPLLTCFCVFLWLYSGPTILQ